MRKLVFKSVSIILFAFGFVVCSAKSSCDSGEIKNALAESIKQKENNIFKFLPNDDKIIPLDDK